jgi:Fic family protein
VFITPPPESVAVTTGIPTALLAKLLDAYRPWRKLRHLAVELKTDPVQAWSAVKAHRQIAWRPLPVKQANGKPFGYVESPTLARLLYLVDRTSGDDLLRARNAGEAALPLRKRIQALFHRGEYVPSMLIARTEMGEAAESSIMEGANTTRQHAIELLREGRAPRTTGERMIVNNFQAMQFMKRNAARPLGVAMLLELQSILTEGTLKTSDGVGRFRRNDENVRITDARDDSVIFRPPDAETVVERLEEICQFANADHVEPFIHPIVVASMLHFFVGYVHPFVDGNGRTARMLFYWYALRHGYGIFELLSISEQIRQGYSRYPQAYLDSELDNGDVTYFVHYKLEIIEQALDALATYLRREEDRLAFAQRLGTMTRDLHNRQALLLELCVRKPTVRLTVKSHANSHGVSLVTARGDLEDFVARGHFTRSTRGKEVVYEPTPTLLQTLSRLSQ